MNTREKRKDQIHFLTRVSSPVLDLPSYSDHSKIFWIWYPVSWTIPNYFAHFNHCTEISQRTPLDIFLIKFGTSLKPLITWY
jgi:hypothetical protein